MKPTEAVRRCIEETIFSLTVEDSGKPVAIFGINPENILGDSAIIWMLSTDHIDGLRKRFARNSRRFVDLMLDYYPNLENYVSVENKKSIEWLKFCGAEFEEPKVYGEEGKLFMRFTFTKNQKRRF
ncbi:MAG: DUF2833 domain-containing protein [Bacteroidia bacterium]|nr:DUF2833 domain-containing protein [Bacteroidia bacterium]